MTAWLSTYGYLLLFAVLAIEGFGVPGIPYEPLFIATGVLINQGHMHLAPAILIGAGGNLAGNIAGYIVGRYGLGRIRPAQLPAWARIGPRRWDEVRRWFEAYGGRTVILSRWFGPIRTPVIFGAGLFGMSFGRYFLTSTIGALLWTAAWQILSWKFGSVVVRIWERHKLVGSSLFLAATALWLLWQFWIWPRRKARRT